MAVSIRNRLRAGRPKNRSSILRMGKLTLLQGNSQRLHPASYPKRTAGFRRCQAVKLTTHLLLGLTLRTHAAMNQFPQYLFIVPYVIKWQQQLYFFLHYSYLNGLSSSSWQLLSIIIPHQHVHVYCSLHCWRNIHLVLHNGQVER
jgi:hypothetical protein